MRAEDDMAWPDDGYDNSQDGCDHEDYDIDIIEGRCRCNRCGESWHATNDEILRAIDAESAYANYQDEMDRRQWWCDLWDRIRSFIPRRKRPVLPPSDDDIPF